MITFLYEVYILFLHDEQTIKKLHSLALNDKINPARNKV